MTNSMFPNRAVKMGRFSLNIERDSSLLCYSQLIFVQRFEDFEVDFSVYCLSKKARSDKIFSII